MLIGLDYYWKLVTGRNKVKKSTDLPIAMETEFGWILVSNSNDPGMHSQSNTNIQTMLITTEIESSLNSGLKKFWDIEQEIIEKPIKKESKQAVRKFHDSVRYDQENKKYIVGLPFIDDNNLGSNYKVAEKSGKVAYREKMYAIGVNNASYHQEESSMAGEMITKTS